MGPISRGRALGDDGEPYLTCWHAEHDTLPWVERRLDDPALVDVTLPIGVWSRVGEVPRVRVAVDVDGGPTRFFSTDDEGITPVTPSSVARRVRRSTRLQGEPGVLERRHHYVDVAAASLASAYFQLVVPRVPRNARLRYTIEVLTPVLDSLHETIMIAFELRASAPEFDGGDLCAAQGFADPKDLDGTKRWALLHRREDGFDHVRLDMLSTIPDDPGRRPAASIGVGGVVFGADTDWSGAQPGEFVVIPLIDRELDSVLVSVPAGGLVPPATIRTGPAGTPVTLRTVDLSTRIPPVQLMIINYCIQGLNDLFEVPNDKYDPPRTYMQVTMRDELGSWSSRPGSAEDGDPDGYALTLDAHRYYRVPSMWAFNAGVLTMIAHDCPDELRRIRDDVRAGLLVPINAGFGAHRPPYYSQAANEQEIRRGQQVIKAFIPESPDEGLRVYYPDQRLYKSEPGETGVYTQDDLVTHLVLDRSTLCYGPRQGRQTQFFADFTPAANQLLLDPATKRRILPIEDEVRNGLIAFEDDDRTRGKASLQMRSLFLQALGGATPPLFVYGDDADKASGCGWFDGDYSGKPVHFNEGYQATLCWLSRHPWVRVVTVADDVVRDAEPVPLKQPLASATCPSVDPGGAWSEDLYGNYLHFDAWVKKWCEELAPWLGRPLGVLSRTVASAVETWPATDPELSGLAWMTFLGLHHEMMWNKEPLENSGTNVRFGVLSPEDFVVAASLQMRNAQVYLAANAWADWARSPVATPVTEVNGGPVLQKLSALNRAGAGGRYWDDDLLPNDIIYNDQVLAVLDRNGGRVTHLFTIDPSSKRVLCVSGTPKAYQWTGPAPGHREWLTCDGSVLENTVLTPNHLYVASDLRESRPRIGWRHEDRPRQPSPRRWLYPDTFDEYVAQPDPAAGAVHYTYGWSSGKPQPGGIVLEAVFQDACRADLEARLPGGCPADVVIWHDADITFTKSIALAGRRLTVHYEQAPPGHLVGNEFCVDVHAALTGRGFQRKWLDASGRTVIFEGPLGGRVALSAGSGCELTSASRLPDLATARADRRAADYLRLHRVLTDAVEIQCRPGGTFEYVVDIG